MEQSEPSRATLESIQTLQKGKASRVVHVAREACREVQKGLLQPIEAAFLRFMKNGIKTDPGCFAKLALLEAMHVLESQNETLLLSGLHYTQLEPVWTPPFTVDTAADLRGNCAMILADMGYSEIWRELVTLLADPEVQARRAAVRALTHVGGERAELLLRAKALWDSDDHEVVSLCLEGLMRVAPDESLEFVCGYLCDAREVVAEGAALALAESHHPAAWPRLRLAWDVHVADSYRTMLLLPMALVRSEESLTFLLEVLREGPRDRAIETLNALRLYRGDEEKVARIRDAVDHHRDRELARRFRVTFGGTS